MKSVLIIEESRLLREYLTQKVLGAGLEVLTATNGLEGSLKLRNITPDLIIVDQMLTRKSCMEFLEEKNANPNNKDTPLILLAERIDQYTLVKMAKLGVSKVISKPLKLDALLNAVSQILDIKIGMDQTPCIIESHFNEEILFIEIAQGLNIEKLLLLKYRIMELLSIYSVKQPKVLIMISDVEFNESAIAKLPVLFDTVIESAQKNTAYIRVLSTAREIAGLVASTAEYQGIRMVETLDKAMDDLIGMKPDAFAHDEVAREKLLKSTIDKSQGSVELRFESEAVSRKLHLASKIAIVDDDFVIRTLIKTVFEDTGWEIREFENGREFVESLKTDEYDLVFLDLSMPVFNGFQVLQKLKTLDFSAPVIVFSALSRKETILKARELGVMTFLRKPLKPEELMHKVADVLGREFS